MDGGRVDVSLSGPNVTTTTSSSNVLHCFQLSSMVDFYADYPLYLDFFSNLLLLKSILPPKRFVLFRNVAFLTLIMIARVGLCWLPDMTLNMYKKRLKRWGTARHIDISVMLSFLALMAYGSLFVTWKEYKEMTLQSGSVQIYRNTTGLYSFTKGLVTNYGEWGATKREGGMWSFTPTKKRVGGGAQKVLAMLKKGGGHKKFWASFNEVAWSFSHIKGGTQKVSALLKGRREEFYPVLRGGGGKKFRTRDFFIL